MNGELLEQYKSWLIALERKSPLTAETYRFEIRRFLEFLAGEKLGVDAVDLAGITAYLEMRRGRDCLDPRSAAKAVSCLRSFFRFVSAEGLRRDNPALLLESPRRGTRLPEVFSGKQMEDILSAVDVSTPLGLRDRALYDLIYSAGLRVSEAVHLDLKDLEFSGAGGLARVTGKGRKERLVIFGSGAAAWLKRYLAEGRPRLAGRRNISALFINRMGKRLSRKGIWKNFVPLTQAAGVSSRLHAMRHTFATELLAGGADLRSVQELLGHSNLATTQIYPHVDAGLLKESHRRFMPELGISRSGGESGRGSSRTRRKTGKTGNTGKEL
jgi:integrase/recombinase XerD